jgi:hypothetical protein
MSRRVILQNCSKSMFPLGGGLGGFSCSCSERKLLNEDSSHVMVGVEFDGDHHVRGTRIVFR